MKKFTLLFFALCCCVFMNAQEELEYRVTEIWNISPGNGEVWDNNEAEWVAGPRLDYINAGVETERAMVFYDGKLYIPSYKNEAAEVLVVDASNGSLIETLDFSETVVSGGQYLLNGIAVDEDGVLILTHFNIGPHTTPFAIYSYDLENAESPADIKELWRKSPTDKDTGEPEKARMGVTNLGLYGTVADEAKLLVPCQESTNIYIYTIKAGQITEEPEQIGLPEPLGLSPVVFGVDANYFIVNSSSTLPTRYNYSGENPDVQAVYSVALDGYENELQFPIFGVSSGVFFEFKGEEFLYAGCVGVDGLPLNTSGQSNGWFAGVGQLVKVPEEGLSEAEHIDFTNFPNGLNGHITARNTSMAVPVCADVQRDAVYLYILNSKSGIAAHKFEIIDPTGVQDVNAEAIAVYPNPAVDVLNIDGEPALVEFYNVAGQKVLVVENQNSVNVAALQGIYLVKITEKSGATTTVKVSVK